MFVIHIFLHQGDVYEDNNPMSFDQDERILKRVI